MLYFVCVQVVDLKKIITRLTKNNGELLEIVKEKIQYEDIIADLEKKTSLLADQLDWDRIFLIWNRRHFLATGQEVFYYLHEINDLENGSMGI